VGILDFFPLAFHLHSINVNLDRLNALIQISYGNLHYVSGFFSSSLFYYMSGGYFSSLVIFAFNKFHL
jgi:hypothetical protein